MIILIVGIDFQARLLQVPFYQSGRRHDIERERKKGSAREGDRETERQRDSVQGMTLPRDRDSDRGVRARKRAIINRERLLI
jgi:hypothetical protein